MLLCFACFTLFGAIGVPRSQTAAPSPPSSSVALGETVRIVFETAEGVASTRDLGATDVVDLEHLAAAWIRVEPSAPAERTPEVAAPQRAEVRILGGERAHGRVTGGSGDLLALELAGGAHLELDVDEIESLLFAARVSPGQLAGLAAAPAGDRLYWIRGSGLDRVDGTLEEFAAEGVRFDSVLGKKTFPWGEVAALFIESIASASSGAPRAPEAQAAERAKGAGLEVTLDGIDGSRLRGRLRRLAGDGCRLERRDGRTLDLPLSLVAEIARADGSIAFLSDLAPAEAQEGSPFDDELGLVWPHRVDVSVTGSPLCAGGRTYRRGLGVHAPSRLTWDLEPGWRTLRGQVAIDESVRLLPYGGSVEFQVLRDGELFWSSGRLRGSGPPVAIPPVPLRGVKRLTLAVEMAENLHVADRADWLELLLVRED